MQNKIDGTRMKHITVMSSRKAGRDNCLRAPRLGGIRNGKNAQRKRPHFSARGYQKKSFQGNKNSKLVTACHCICSAATVAQIC